MKKSISAFLILLLLGSLIPLEAGPRHGRHSRRSPHYVPHYYHHYPYYRATHYVTPWVVTTRTVTTYPQNLVTLTAAQVAEDIVALNQLMGQGMISEKEYERSKKTLLNRIGMTVNPDSGEPGIRELIDQIKTLYEMRQGHLITDKEYQVQKQKLLAMI